jgi:hypothetical protein
MIVELVTNEATGATAMAVDEIVTVTVTVTGVATATAEIVASAASAI